MPLIAFTPPSIHKRLRATNEQGLRRLVVLGLQMFIHRRERAARQWRREAGCVSRDIARWDCRTSAARVRQGAVALARTRCEAVLQPQCVNVLVYDFRGGVHV